MKTDTKHELAIPTCFGWRPLLPVEAVDDETIIKIVTIPLTRPNARANVVREWHAHCAYNQRPHSVPGDAERHRGYVDRDGKQVYVFVRWELLDSVTP